MLLANGGGTGSLDDLDLRLIALLRGNPRATTQSLAETLGVSPTTVSFRMRRLDSAGAMRIVAVTDFAVHGCTVLAVIGVKVRGRDVRSVADDLADLREVLSVNLMTGEHDLELLVGFRNVGEIDVFLLERVARIEGVAALSPALAADIVKYDFTSAPLSGPVRLPLCAAPSDARVR